ncbi:MAG: serine hydrolase [Acidobacteria bacterium]|nr:serine hydrolase [Acidobacteriota bacterium]
MTHETNCRWLQRGVLVTCSIAALLAAHPRAQVSVPDQTATAPESVATQIDRIFERWDRGGTPGCAVGVSERGTVVYTRGYGMANLEYGVRIKPDTIFESGSVAKQFTSAAIALLAIDGKLSRQDPVRKYVPELPDFGTPITIQQLLNHTSGLRSQWPMLSLAGRPPGMAVHTVDEILELVSHYKELNFKPGDEYLYNNTAFTLLGVIVQRVSGKSLNDFTKIVPDRATAYRADAGGQFRTNMPFTNVIGNGGLLTTVGDLLIWNENLDRPRVGGKEMVDQLQKRGRLNDGFENEYAQGLVVTDYRGVREVSHGGSTGGYQTFLARWPDERLSVAVLCNTTGTNPGGYAHQVADVFLAGALKAVPVPASVTVPAGALAQVAGLYRERATDAVVRVAWDNDKKTLRIGGQVLIPTGVGVLSAGDGARTVSVLGAADGERPAWPTSEPAARLLDRDSRTKPRIWDREQPFAPTPAQLAAFAGEYFCEELGVTYLFYVEAESLKVRFRPAQRFTLTPVFQDAFEGDGNIIRFTRGAAGSVDGLRIYAGRVRHLRFVRR